MSLAPPSVPAAASTSVAVPEQQQQQDRFRDSLNGSWILDKNRGDWSMRGYLETLNVPELAIQANEKGENELDTIHTIEITSTKTSEGIKKESGSTEEDDDDDEEEEQQHHNNKVKIIKRSRVNNDLIVELILGKESIEYLKPDDRQKKQIATSDDKTNLKIVSSLLTVNGMAHVTDTKRLIQEETTTTEKESEDNGLEAIKSEIETNNSNSNSKSRSVMVQELTITNPETKNTHTTTRYFNPCETPVPLSPLIVETSSTTTTQPNNNNNNNNNSNIKMED
jgi:hypothetical protein